MGTSLFAPLSGIGLANASSSTVNQKGEIQMLEKLLEIVSGLPTNAVLREQREFLLAQIGTAKDRLEELERAVSERETRIRELEQQVAAQAKSEEFVEHRAALFKRIGSTGNRYSEAVYCPNCRRAAGIMGVKVVCGPCSWIWRYSSHQISSFLVELRAKG